MICQGTTKAVVHSFTKSSFTADVIGMISLAQILQHGHILLLPA